LATVTSVLRRAAAPFAVVTALVASLTACGTGPSQVNSAVIIDDRVISVDDVQAIIDKVVEDPAARQLSQQHKLDLVAREAVTQLITHQLLTEAAKDEGLRVNESDLKDLRENNPFDEELPTDGSVPTEQLVPALVNKARGFDAYANDTLLLTELAKKYLGRVSATVNVALFDKPDKARELADKVFADPGGAPTLMREASAAGMEPQLGLDTGPSPLGMRLLAPKNSVMMLYEAPTAQSAGGYVVVQIVSTDIADSPSPDFNPAQVDTSQLPDVGKYMLRERVLAGNIKISPRYGIWNAADMKVVPKSEADVAGFVLVPKSDQP
jgi:hypothetical protein